MLSRFTSNMYTSDNNDEINNLNEAVKCLHKNEIVLLFI
jgi:hypothetical protein